MDDQSTHFIVTFIPFEGVDSDIDWAIFEERSGTWYEKFHALY